MLRIDFNESYFNEERKYRDTYIGGKDFVNRYLIKYSERESDTDFRKRRAITFCPAFAKAAVNDIRNSIFQRIASVERLNGPSSYQQAINGLNGGVDLKSSTMHNFIGLKILPELLSMRRIGVLIDRDPINTLTLADATPPPYLYTYKSEQIKSIVPGKGGQPVAVELEEEVNLTDSNGFPTKQVTRKRKYWESDNVVKYEITTGSNKIEGILNIKKLPFAIFDIGASLLHDVADYQIALLNIESSDLSYILQSNYPFYVEKGTNTSTHLKTSTDKDVLEVGGTQGRRYVDEKPGFIAPPTEPLLASIKKQNQMKADIKTLVNLALENLGSANETTDDRSLEAGLSFIAQVLEQGERQIALIWGDYERVDPATVKYPTKYNLKTTKEALEEAQEYRDMLPALPSNTYKKRVGFQIAKVLLGNHVPPEILNDIYAEIEKSKVMIADPDVVFQSVEDGMLGLELGAETLGIPSSQVPIAQKEHAERLARIQAAQTNNIQGGARGLKDQAIHANEDAKIEKTASQDSTLNADPGGRGEGK